MNGMEQTVHGFGIIANDKFMALQISVGEKKPKQC